jgi:hypothetical protein
MRYFRDMPAMTVLLMVTRRSTLGGPINPRGQDRLYAGKVKDRAQGSGLKGSAEVFPDGR